MTILAVRHERHEGLGFLEKVFKDEGVSYRYLDVFENPNLSVDFQEASGLVVLGGAMGVYEAPRYPFLEKEIDILKEAVRRKIPTLGICLGSQLLAAAGGAEVYRGPQKEIGWFPIRMRPEARLDPILRHLPSETQVFHWHGDTFDLPKGAEYLVSSERYQNQAFRIGDSAWGLQFHLEVTGLMIREWVEEAERTRKTASPDFNSCEILTQTPCFLPDMEALARKVFGEFVSFAKRAATR